VLADQHVAGAGRTCLAGIEGFLASRRRVYVTSGD